MAYVKRTCGTKKVVDYSDNSPCTSVYAVVKINHSGHCEVQRKSTVFLRVSKQKGELLYA